MPVRPLLASLALPLASLLLAGCTTRPPSVSGAVTYDGQPVAKGNITFTPVDGKGAVVGAPISAGKYTVGELAAGPKTVHISAPPETEFPKSTAELEKQAAAAGNNPVEPPRIEDLVPADAIGNGVQVEIQAGAQVRDFHLKKPAG